MWFWQNDLAIQVVALVSLVLMFSVKFLLELVSHEKIEVICDGRESLLAFKV